MPLRHSVLLGILLLIIIFPQQSTEICTQFIYLLPTTNWKGRLVTKNSSRSRSSDLPLRNANILLATEFMCINIFTNTNPFLHIMFCEST